MLHETIFLAACNAAMTNKKPFKLRRGCHTFATFVALQVARKIASCNMAFILRVICLVRTFESRARATKSKAIRREGVWWRGARFRACSAPVLQLEPAAYYVVPRPQYFASINHFRVTWNGVLDTPPESINHKGLGESGKVKEVVMGIFWAGPLAGRGGGEWAEQSCRGH